MARTDETMVGEVEGSTTEENTLQFVAYQLKACGWNQAKIDQMLKYLHAYKTLGEGQGNGKDLLIGSGQPSPAAAVSDDIKTKGLFIQLKKHKEAEYLPKRPEGGSQKTALACAETLSAEQQEACRTILTGNLKAYDSEHLNEVFKKLTGGACLDDYDGTLFILDH